MIEVKIYHHPQHGLTGLEATGHAGEMPRGNNILCAAFSILFEVLVAAAENLPADSVEHVRDDEIPHWKLVVQPELIPSDKWRMFQHTLNSTSTVARRIVDSNTDSCRLSAVDLT